jgi:thioredoxin reductase
MTFKEAKVIIVGAGPTGMTAAMELARQLFQIVQPLRLA